MAVFRRSIEIRAPAREVFAFHLDPANLARVAPPESRTELLSASEIPLRLGAHVVVRSVQMGVPVTIEAEIVAMQPDRMFEDRQVKGPFKLWRHRHLFEPIEEGTRLTDDVEFEAPGGVAARLLERTVILPQLEKAFAYRQAATKRLLEPPAPTL